MIVSETLSVADILHNTPITVQLKEYLPTMFE